MDERENNHTQRPSAPSAPRRTPVQTSSRTAPRTRLSAVPADRPRTRDGAQSTKSAKTAKPVKNTENARSAKPVQKKKAPKKDPLWETVVVAILLFFMSFGKGFLEAAAETARFWAGVFVGIARGISGIHSNRKKKKAEKREIKKETARRLEIDKAEKAQRREIEKTEKAKRQKIDKAEKARRREIEKAEKARRKKIAKAEKARQRKIDKAEDARRKEEKRRAEEKEKKEAREEKRRRKEEKKAYKKRRRRFLATKIPALLLAIVLFFELSVIGCAGVLFFVQSLRSDADELTMILVINSDTRVSATVPKQAAGTSVGSQPCFDLTFAAQQLGFLAFGTGSDMIYTLPNGQTLQVGDGSNTVYIDRMPVSLDGVVTFYNDRVYASTELLRRCVSGVSVNFDKDKKTLTLLCSVRPEEITLRQGAIDALDGPSFV